MPDIFKDINISEQFSILAITPIIKLQERINNILKRFSEEDLSGIYVSFSKPYETLKNIFSQNNISIEKIFFIDCISKSIEGREKKNNVFYISNAGDLDDLGISITEILENNKIDFLLIDSLETLLIYNKINTVAIFTQSLVRKSIKFKLKTIILTSNGDKKLTDEIAMFFDKIIEAN